MFEYTKAELAEKANEINFVRDTLEKVLRLSEVLRYLNTNPMMKENLVLKGGTAINLTVFNLPRLSVDIDLDFAQNVEREVMMETRKRIRENIRRYMETQGYTISSRGKAFHSLDSFVFTYTNLGGMNDNIKIEINYSLRAHDFEKINAITIRKIKTDLLPVIQKGEFFELEYVKAEVTRFLQELLALERNEEKFLSEFKEKRYQPELLFNDTEILERIRNHPMALWKTRSQ